MTEEQRGDLIVNLIGAAVMVVTVALAAYVQRKATDPDIDATVKRFLHDGGVIVKAKPDIEAQIERQFWREVSWLEHEVGR